VIQQTTHLAGAESAWETPRYSNGKIQIMERIHGQYAFALKPAEQKSQSGNSALDGGCAEVFFVELGTYVLEDKLGTSGHCDRRALHILDKVSKVSAVGAKSIRGEVPDHPTMLEKARKGVGNLSE
jgi:hypothetical protein